MISTTHTVCKTAGESKVKPARVNAPESTEAKLSAAKALARKPLSVMQT